MFPYIFIFSYLGSPFLGGMTGIVFLNCMLSLYFNKTQKYLLSRVLFLISISAPIYFYSAMLGPGAGIQYAGFAIFPATFILFDGG